MKKPYLISVFAFLLSFAVHAETLCDKAISTDYNHAISELAQGYANLENMRIADSPSKASRLRIQKDLDATQVRLRNQVNNDDRFDRLYNSALAANGARVSQDQSSERRTRKENLIKESKDLAFWKIKATIDFKRNAISSIHTAQANDYVYLAVDGSKIIIYDSHLKTVVREFTLKDKSNLERAILNSSGSELFVPQDAIGAIINTSSGEVVARFDHGVVPHASNTVYRGAWLDDDQIIATDSWEGKLRFWDRSTGLELVERSISRSKVVNGVAKEKTLMGVKANSRSSNFFFRSSDTKSYEFHNLFNPHQVVTAQDVGIDIDRIYFSPDGLLAATTNSMSTMMTIFEVSTGNIKAQFKTTEAVEDLIWFPGQERAVFLSAQKVVRIIDMSRGDEISSFDGGREFIAKIALSSDGERIITSSPLGLVHVWEREISTDND